MPCGQKCKELIDQGYALIQAINCMNASILLTADGDGPSAALVDGYLASARTTAEAAQKLARSLTPA